jgi:hypothetical protein
MGAEIRKTSHGRLKGHTRLHCLVERDLRGSTVRPAADEYDAPSVAGGSTSGGQGLPAQAWWTSRNPFRRNRGATRGTAGELLAKAASADAEWARRLHACSSIHELHTVRDQAHS